MPLLFLLALFTIADFVVLFAVGAKIGFLAALLWIVVSAAFGFHLIRRESFLTLQRARERLNRGEIPSDELLAGASFVLSGLLLLAPGFLSDIAGILCLLPGGGQLLRRWFGNGTLREAGVCGASTSRGRADWADHHHADTGSRQHSGAPLEGDYLGKDEHRR